ncbi:hypothetical protein DFH09DRAFT_1273310 [Mycena vulgaris]|nr:hypothetical protein DFH09DRAFT_1273310 [Mycena vulgaris]
MTEFRSTIPLPHIPDDLTVPQFLLNDYKHPIGEMRKDASDVWFIDDLTGRKFTFGEVCLQCRACWLLSVTGYLATYVFSVLYRSLVMSWEHRPGLDKKAWVLRTRLDYLAEFWLSCNGWVNFLRSHPKNSHFRVVVFPSEEFGLPMPPSLGKNLSVKTPETG